MFLMRADPLRGEVGGGWALEIETFLGPEMATSEASTIWSIIRPDHHRLLFTRHVQVQLRPLWCRHVQPSTDSCLPDCGVDTSRPSQSPVYQTRPGAAQAPVV